MKGGLQRPLQGSCANLLQMYDDACTKVPRDAILQTSSKYTVPISTTLKQYSGCQIRNGHVLCNGQIIANVSYY